MISDRPPGGSAEKRWRPSATVALASVIWRQTDRGQIEGGIAGGAAKNGTLRSPCQGNRSATFSPQEKGKPWDDHITETMPSRSHV